MKPKPVNKTMTHIETDFGVVTVSGKLQERLDAIRYETRKQDRRRKGVRDRQARAQMSLEDFTEKVNELMAICHEFKICDSIKME